MAESLRLPGYDGRLEVSEPTKASSSSGILGLREQRRIEHVLVFPHEADIPYSGSRPEGHLSILQERFAFTTRRTACLSAGAKPPTPELRAMGSYFEDRGVMLLVEDFGSFILRIREEAGEHPPIDWRTATTTDPHRAFAD